MFKLKHPKQDIQPDETGCGASSISQLLPQVRAQLFDEPDGDAHKTNPYLHMALTLKISETAKAQYNLSTKYNLFQRFLGKGFYYTDTIRDLKADISLIKTAINYLADNEASSKLIQLQQLASEAEENAEEGGYLSSYNHYMRLHSHYIHEHNTIVQAQEVALECVKFHLPEYFEN